MATASVVAAGSALALYLYSRKCEVDEDQNQTLETHAAFHKAPENFGENLYFFVESLRYTFSETLGRWRTADLLIGIAYLCRKDNDEHPCTDIAQHGRPYGQNLLPQHKQAALAELKEIERFFRYCKGLRERQLASQRVYIHTVLNIAEEDLLIQEFKADLLKPSYILTRDRQLNAIVLAIRGTHSFRDAFTSLTGASKPHHVFDSNGVVLGYSHFGMLAAARWLKTQLRNTLEQALIDNPGYRLKIIGHSLGGGTAALMTMMLRESGGRFAETTCVAIACPACMTLELAKSCSGYVTTVIHSADVIPTVSPGAADKLRVEVMQSSWFREFKSDMRSSTVVKAVESGIKGVGSVTLSATSWTTRRISACYQRNPRQQLKRRNSDDDLRKLEEEEGRGKDSSLPLSSAPPPSSSTPTHNQLPTTEPLQQQPQQWTRRVAGWTQQVTSITGRGITETSRVAAAAVQTTSTQAVNAVQSTGNLLSRMWNGNSSGVAGTSTVPSSTTDLNDDDDKDDDDIDDVQVVRGGIADGIGMRHRFDTANADAPEALEMEFDTLQEEEEGFNLDFGADDDDDEDRDGGGGDHDGDHHFDVDGGDGSGRFSSHKRRLSGSEGGSGRDSRSQRHNRRGSLESELDIRMAEVAAAVSAAEAEEERNHSGHDTVPSVIPVGEYSGSTAHDRKNDVVWKRMMYPAGRIMHIVPARLVPGFTVVENEDDNNIDADCNGDGVLDAGRETKDNNKGKAPMMSVLQMESSFGRVEQLETDDLDEDMLQDTSTSLSAMETDALLHNNTTKPTTQGTGTNGAGPSASAAAPPPNPSTQEQQQQQQLEPVEPMVLLDGLPQEAYGRIKLGRRVIADHIIPNYLRSLESALKQMPWLSDQ